MQKEENAEQISLFIHDFSDGKMCPVQPPREPRPVRTFESFSKRLSELSAVPFMSLDLTPGNGNLLGEYSWAIISPSRFGCSTLNTGVSPREGSACSLSQILMEQVPRKYYLSRKACRGILRRARERGKPLPTLLKAALEAQAGIFEVKKEDILGYTAAYAANQYDEVRNLHDESAAFCTPSGVRKQTFVAVSEVSGKEPPEFQGEVSTTKVYCLNDQGGQRMDCSFDQSGTLLAQTSHAPVVYENHGIDSRYTGPHSVVPTMSARWGTGGNNTPLVSQPETICIAGNIIDREPKNGGNGLGCQSELAYTLTATDKHAVFCRKRVDVFQRDEVASTQSARQSKDATDLVIQEGPACLLIRRLVPRECELLQGYPPGWTDLPGASDSARYKALGNSVAIPCVKYILRGIALVLRSSQ